MKITLGALGKASDPFGYVPPEIVNVPDRPTNDRSGAFKLAPAESFLPSTEPPARFAASDNFAGLGDAPPSGNYSSIKLAPLPADGFFGTAPVSGQAIKLAPEQRSGDMFEAFGPTPAPTPAPAAKPADGEFVKAGPSSELMTFRRGDAIPLGNGEKATLIDFERIGPGRYELALQFGKRAFSVTVGPRSVAVA